MGLLTNERHFEVAWIRAENLREAATGLPTANDHDPVPVRTAHHMVLALHSLEVDPFSIRGLNARSGFDPYPNSSQCYSHKIKPRNRFAD
jgi:hypothetical protein